MQYVILYSIAQETYVNAKTQNGEEMDVLCDEVCCSVLHCVAV